MSDLYATDILLWSEEQADRLRRRTANDIDWENVAEEIGDVGRSELRAVESLPAQALRHMLKAEAWPLLRDAPSWRADAIDFRQQPRRRFTPSMGQRIDVASLYADALRSLPETVDGMAPLSVPAACPVTLTEVLALAEEGVIGHRHPPWRGAATEEGRRMRFALIVALLALPAGAAHSETSITSTPGPFRDWRNLSGTVDGKRVTGTTKPGAFKDWTETDLKVGGQSKHCTTRPGPFKGDTVTNCR